MPARAQASNRILEHALPSSARMHFHDCISGSSPQLRGCEFRIPYLPAGYIKGRISNARALCVLEGPVKLWACAKGKKKAHTGPCTSSEGPNSACACNLPQRKHLHTQATEAHTCCRCRPCRSSFDLPGFAVTVPAHPAQHWMLHSWSAQHCLTGLLWMKSGCSSGLGCRKQQLRGAERRPVLAQGCCAANVLSACPAVHLLLCHLQSAGYYETSGINRRTASPFTMSFVYTGYGW